MKINELINEFKAPKNQYNSFGKYKFRNNEDIQTALKPLLLKYDMRLESSSEPIELSNEIVISVHLRLYDGEIVVASGDGHAVVDLNKKGMDKGQATGAAFSYASKYAFGQMLLIDDTKDADSMDNRTPAPKNGSIYTMAELKQLVAGKHMTSAQANAYVKQHGIK
nr:MAG TPA: ERF superfamily protein [Caudoviricetes sp.]